MQCDDAEVPNTGRVEILIHDFKNLKNTEDHKNIFIPDNIDESLFNELHPIELELISQGLEILPIVSDIFERYNNLYTNYSDWESFWASNKAEVDHLCEILVKMRDFIPLESEFAFYKQYFDAQIRDWQNGANRDNSESEILWYDALPTPRVDFRGLPRIESGEASYIHPIEGAGDMTYSIRLKVPKELPPETKFIGDAIVVDSDQEELWGNSAVVVTEDIILGAAGLHGYKEAGKPTGHQYKNIAPDGTLRIAIISNANIQSQNKKALLDFTKAESFSADFFEAAKEILANSGINLLYGHEVAEALIEYIHPMVAKNLGGREAIEIASTLIVFRALWEAGANTPERTELKELYWSMAVDFLAKLKRTLSLESNKKSAVYQRGYKVFLDRLNDAEAIEYDENKKITGIKLPDFTYSLILLLNEIEDMMEAGAKEVNDKMFGLTQSE